MNLILTSICVTAGLVAGFLLNTLINQISASLQGSATPDATDSKAGIYKSKTDLSPVTYLIRQIRRQPGNNRISISGACVEILCPILWYWAYSQYDLPEAVLFIIIISALIVISRIDFKWMIIPLSMILTSLSSLVLYNIIFHGHLRAAVWGITAGIGYLGGMMLLTSLLFHKQTMGFGDLQLIVVLGAWLGVLNVLMTILAGAVISLFTWVALSMRDGFDRNRPLPFGPFLSIAGVALYMLNPNWQQLLGFLF